ncbi:hypothetical protein MHBO_005063 [Bonamia ostreae]|uniref:PH domain-containing protein n=1 Tax=Bonamia ostreae TaxID=126728 RepID=A0ABV2AVQ1_9EUKA
MKEVEGVESGKTSKALKKAKSAVEENCFTVIAAGGQENSFQLENKGDREIWVNGLRLVLSTVANRRPADMVW